jgi:hypothetical protein
LVPFRCFGTISADPATALIPDPGLLPGEECDPSPLAPVPIAERCYPPADGLPASGDPCPPRSFGGPAAVRQRISPSFAIRGAAPAAGGPSGWAVLQPRLDRINSAELLRLARAAYFGWLSGGGGSGDPFGIVLARAGAGRVVFELPVLLPGEQFVPIEWLRPRGQGRGRSGRSAAPPRPPG